MWQYGTFSHSRKFQSGTNHCTLPARVSAHTENVHFLKPDEEHFYLKAINAVIRKQSTVYSQGMNVLYAFLEPNTTMCNYHYTVRLTPLRQEARISHSADIKNIKKNLHIYYYRTQQSRHSEIHQCSTLSF